MKIFKKVKVNLLRNTPTISRLSIFLVYFWFGILKVLGESPAEELVLELQSKTISFIDGDTFMILLGLGEMLIGFLFLFPKLTKIAVPVFFLHIFTTFLPLIFLADTSWQSFLVPTLEGQYIIKNLVLIALVLNIWKDDMKPQN